jgi:hypothetical protein
MSWAEVRCRAVRTMGGEGEVNADADVARANEARRAFLV